MPSHLQVLLTENQHTRTGSPTAITSPLLFSPLRIPTTSSSLLSSHFLHLFLFLFHFLMGKNKKVSAPAAAESSSSGSRAKQNLEALNAKLTMEMEEQRKEIERLQQLLAAATGELHAAEMRLVNVVRETEDKKKEINDLKEKLRSSEEEAIRHGEKRWKKKWVFYPAAAAATVTVCVAAAMLLFSSSSGSSTRFKD